MATHVTRMPIFKGSTSESWTSYAERLEFFFKGNKITEDEQKHALLLSSFEPSTFELIKSLVQPATVESKSYSDVVTLLKQHYDPQPSAIVCRYRFNSRNRKPSESVSAFVAELRSLAEHCKFGANLDEMIRDRLVCGIEDPRIQRRLLQEPDSLTYESAYKLAIAMETASKDVLDLQKTQTEQSTSIQKVDKRAPKPPRRNPPSCYRCNGQHLSTECRFRSVNCRRCGKKGHIASACQSKPRSTGYQNKAKQRSTNQVTVGEEAPPDCPERSPPPDVKDEETYTLFTVVGKTRPIVVTVNVNNQPTLMEVDTGAAISIISKSTFDKTFSNQTLKPSNISLKTYTGQSLRVLGMLEVYVEHNAQSETLPLIVVEGNGPNLLGRNWLEKIRLDWSTIYNVVASQSLEKVLQSHPKLFREELGCLKSSFAQIYVTADVQPKFCKARPVPYFLKEKIEQELQKLEKQGIIKPVECSDWATPVVPVLKANGNIRLCGDYKITVNKYTQRDVYPLPRVEDLFAALGGGTIFSKIDLTSAYQQIPLVEVSKKYTVINTHKGLFRYERLPFGISTAPSIFQRQIECILQGLPGVCAYLDDILIMGTDEQDHLANLNRVLDCLETAGFTIQQAKCTFATKSIEYLGHVIDSAGLHPAPSKIEAINRAPEPNNISELKSFLGLINYYCKFLANLSTLLSPLYRLLTQNTPWTWSTTERKAFQKAKELLTSSTVLTHFDPAKEIILMCDASPFGVGAVLAHRMEDGGDRPIAYASRTLSPTEKKYCQLEKEGLAIVFGVKRFHQFLYGRKFTIFSDHQPLKYLFSESRQVPVLASSRVQRWALTLSAYDYTMQYRPGSKMTNADALSRAPVPDSPSTVPEPGDLVFLINHLSRAIVTADQIRTWTDTDPLLSKVFRQVQQGWSITEPEVPLRPYYRRKDELSTHQGCLLWGTRVIIPPPGRSIILNQLHETHPGITRMKRLARSFVWWPGIDQEIEERVKSCRLCEETHNIPAKAPIHPWEWPSRPWARVHIDHAGPVNGKLLLIIVDAHSKWIEAHIVSSTSASATIAVLQSVFATHGIPEQLVSDNGTGFSSLEFKEFTSQNGIYHTFTSPYHPAANGLAERSVQVVKKALNSLKQGENMTEHLNKFLMQYRIIPHSTTGVSPSELLMGRRIRTTFDRVFPNIGQKVLHKQEQQKKTVTSRTCHHFIVGDKVYARNYGGRKQKWMPATVIKITGPLSYLIRTADNQEWRRHKNQLRIRHVPDQPTEDDDFDNFPSPITAPQTSDNPGSNTSSQVSNNNTPPLASVPSRRSNRLKRPPNRFAPFLS